MNGRRVVVTGLGLVCPVGNSVAAAWEAIVNGRSGVAPIRRFDAGALSVRIAGEVKDFDIAAYISPKEARKMDGFIHYGIAAAAEALADSGLTIDDAGAVRTGVAVGSGIGGLGCIEAGVEAFLNGGQRKLTPFYVPRSIVNMVAGNVSILHGLKGPNLSVVTACTTGTHNIGLAARMIAYGDADAMLAGGAELGTTPTGVAGFAAARALSSRNDDPAAASRPWDVDRDGFVIGDGAGVLVLEEYRLARARGATIYAELTGFGMSGDAYHMTLPEPGGDGARRAMAAALADAAIDPDRVGYINAHATSTPAGDVIEIDAIRAVFGAHARELAISSTKSMTGHLLGAAGGIEAVFSVLALRDRVAPPTINLDRPADGCGDLNLVAHEAQPRRIDVALSNSFGFGGTNATIVLRRPD